VRNNYAVKHNSIKLTQPTQPNQLFFEPNLWVDLTHVHAGLSDNQTGLPAGKETVTKQRTAASVAILLDGQPRQQTSVEDVSERKCGQVMPRDDSDE